MATTRCICYLLIAFTCFTQSCFSTSSQSNEPWLTGPIITPSARVVPQGHFNLEPYFFWTTAHGVYDNHGHVVKTPVFHQALTQMVYKVGLTENIDLEGLFQWAYNRTEGQSASVFGDIPVGFDIQLLKEGKSTPYLKVTIQETFPTGKYNNLDPNKLGTDRGGFGTYATTVGIGASKTIFFGDHHYLRWRTFISAAFLSSVNVKGTNAFGGGIGTKGRVSPGNVYGFVFGAEYTLSLNWALAFDYNISYANRDKFKGRTLTVVGSPYSVEMSIAPAIEYNWSDSMGIIIGPWFSIGGRNANRFASAVAAFNYYH